MPDQWGRPTFNDGMAIAQGLWSVRQDMKERNIAEIAQKVAENPEWTPGEGENYTPETLYQGRIRGIAAYMDKLSLSEAQMKERVARYELDRRELEKRIVPLLADDSPEGRAKLYEAFSEYSGSGITIAPADEGKIEVTYPDGRKSVQQAPSSEQITQMAQSILDPRGFINQRLAWDRYKKEKNIELLEKAQDLRDPKSGNPIGVKFTHQIDPSTHKLRPVYINVATEMELNEAEIKDLHKKGLITTDNMKVYLELQKKAIDTQKAQYDLLKSMYGAEKAKAEAGGKGATVTDIKTIEQMIFDATRDGPPSESQVALINKAANKIGMEYKMVSAGSEGGWFGVGAEKPKYALVDKQTGQPVQDESAPAGANPGTPAAGLASATGGEAKPNPQPESSSGKKTRRAQLPDGTIAEVALNEKTGRWEPVFIEQKPKASAPKEQATEALGGMSPDDYKKEVNQVARWIREDPGKAKGQKERLVRNYGEEVAEQIIKDAKAINKALKETPHPANEMAKAGIKAVGSGLQSAARWVDQGATKAHQPW